jgi:Holliday junction resolvasome RuvABC endonuclease subunit
MSTIGIDQSFTSTGLWSSSTNNHKVINTKPVDKKDQLEVFKRARYITNEVIAFIIEEGDDVTDVNIEGLSFAARGDATRSLAILQGLIVDSLISYHRPLRIRIITPTSLKKLATDDGRADKDKMFEYLPDDIKKVIEAIPKSKGRGDLTDAYWLSKV